jgi:hypothetical protein
MSIFTSFQPWIIAKFSPSCHVLQLQTAMLAYTSRPCDRWGFVHPHPHIKKSIAYRYGMSSSSSPAVGHFIRVHSRQCRASTAGSNTVRMTVRALHHFFDVSLALDRALPDT